MTRRRGTYRKRFAIGLAIAGLFCQLIVTALAIPAALAAMHPGDLPEGYSTIIICTGDGMKRIIVDADGTPVGESEEDPPSNPCLACQVVGNTVFLPTSVSVSFLIAHPIAPLTPLSAQTHIRNPGCVHAHKRAPPLEL